MIRLPGDRSRGSKNHPDVRRDGSEGANESHRTGTVVSSASLPRASSAMDLDDEPDVMRVLTDDQKEQVGELLEQYLTEMESGIPPSVEQLTQSTPELREALRVCVSGLEKLHRMVGGVEAADEDTIDEVMIPSHNKHPEGFVASSSKTSRDSQILGDFQIHESIGRGGMGVVYRATQLSLNRTVAVKVLPLASVLDPRQLTRFQHEAEAAANLQHPNIVPVHSIGCERGVHFFAMQYIDGESLQQWIERTDESLSKGGHNEWQTPVRFAVQVAQGLQAAHEYGIIHRDIKPSNLLLDHRDNVWIADFGLVRIQSDTSVTGPADVVGTVRYMSPEQARGESALVDGRTDVYSLAATLYEMLTRKPAHAGEQTPEILRQMHEGTRAPLRQLRPELPPDLETVVAKAMSPRRDDRYETALEFADDLQRVLAGEPTIARPPTLTDRVFRKASKHRNAVFATIIVGCMAFAGLSIATTMLATAKEVSDALALQSQQDKAIARDAVDRLGMQVSELLADIPAADSVRHRLLNETLDYYQQIAATNAVKPTDDQQRMDLAITYGKIGLFQSELGQPNLAIESLRESERLYADLASESPDDRDLNLQWSISQNNLGLRMAESGKLESASNWFAGAIETQKRLGEDVELARTLNNLGGMLSDADKIEQSQQIYDRAIQLLDNTFGSGHGQQPQREGLATSSTTPIMDLRATIRANLAGVLAKQDPNRAITLASESLALQTAKLQKDSSDPKLATQVMLTLNTLADAQATTKRYDSATHSLRQAVRIGEQLHARWPDHPSYRRDLTLSLNQLGLTLAAAGEFDTALDALGKAEKHGKELCAFYPGNAEIENMLGGILNNLGFVIRQLRDPAAARKVYQEAIEHQRRAIALAPENRSYEASLRTQHINLRKLGGES